MPIIDADGCPIHVVVEGPEKAPALLLSNSLGTNLHMWDEQAKELVKDFRLVRYDSRGHGRSGAPSGAYTIERLGRDAVAVIDGLGLSKVHWCGLSMGGMVGQWIGANAGDRIGKLVLANTAAHYDDKKLWDDRIATVLAKGMDVLVQATMERWYTKAFRDSAPGAVARTAEMVRTTPAIGYAGCCAAIRDIDFRQSNTTIRNPTLVIAGRFDPATPVDANEAIRAKIPGAQLTVLDAAHLSNIEQPYDFTEAVAGFLLQR